MGFGAMSFSSEAGAVKPAPEPFVDVLEKLGAKPEDSVFVGDSARRDLGGAKAAGIPCVLVGGAEHEEAAASYPTLLEFVEQVAV